MNNQNLPKALGSNSAGQSGADQGLPDTAEADSESVKELAEEGQFFEANVVEGVEDAPDPDVSEVRTRQVPEDDVPPRIYQPGLKFRLKITLRVPKRTGC